MTHGSPILPISSHHFYHFLISNGLLWRMRAVVNKNMRASGIWDLMIDFSISISRETLLYRAGHHFQISNQFSYTSPAISSLLHIPSHLQSHLYFTFSNLKIIIIDWIWDWIWGKGMNINISTFYLSLFPIGLHLPKSQININRIPKNNGGQTLGKV